MYRPLLYLLLCTATVTAQVAAPDLLCTRSEAGGEILTWENVANDCGPYQATEIYRASDPAGPFTLLTELTDPTQTEYRDDNPAGIQLFYYLQYRYDCPGVEILTSDTLDSFIPVTPLLQYVSVADDALVLGWEPSPSPEVSGYVILEVTPGGILPIDTVGDVTTYRIPGVPDDERTTRQYRIAAIDPCGNDSPQSRVAAARGLTGSGGQGCTSAVTLTPITSETASILTTAPVGEQQLFASVDGGPFTEVALTTDSTGALVFDEGNDGETICFYAGTQVDSNVVRTDTFCLTLDITPPIRPFVLYGAEISGGQVRIPLEDVGNPTPTEAFLNSFVTGTLTVDPLLPTELDSDEVIVTPSLPAAQIDSFKLVVRDECDREVVTNAVAPVVLSAAPAPGDGAQLDWSPLVNNLPGTTTYTVLQVLPDGSLLPLATDLRDRSYLDTSPFDGLRCYRIQASFVPAADSTAFPFLSNEACVAEEPEVYLPNVFSPEAEQPVNQVFGPQFGGVPLLAGYELLVFDRWGALVFATDNPGQPWTGDYADGRRAPTGNYVYTLSYTSATGNFSRLTGVVHLIR